MATRDSTPFNEGPEIGFSQKRQEPPAAIGLVRPRPRARCLRRRLRRRHQGPPVAHHRRAGAARPGQPAAPGRLRLRGGDGRRRRHPRADAGPVSAQGDRAARHHAAARRRQYGAGFVFLPHAEAAREQIRGLFESIVREEGQQVLGWRNVPTDDRTARRVGRRGRAAVRAGLHRRRERVRRGLRRTGALRAQAVRHPQAGRARGRSAGRARGARLLHPEPLGEDADLQRDADRRPDRPDVPRSGRSRLRVGARARAPAVQHEHVSVVAARASVPVHRAQRRDQHAARQHQLDAGARRAAPLGAPRRRPRRRFCRSSARAAATRRRSTTSSSSSS